jgi:SsrA-binding protein
MKPYLVNKQATWNYETLETFEAGLSLLGGEVKSLRLGHASINESFIVIEEGELFLIKAYIPPYQIKNSSPAYDPYRKRKLLITKKEFRNIARRKTEAGLTLIPISLYDKNGFLKLQIALARGLKKHDKRNVLKDRDAKREIGRMMKI